MHASFRARIVLALLSISLISICLFFAASYDNTLRALEKNYIHANAENMDFQLKIFDEYMADAYRLSIRMSEDAVLRQKIEEYIALPQVHLDNVIALSAMLHESIQTSSVIDMLYLYLPDRGELICSSELHMQRTVQQTGSYPWIESAAAAGFAPVLFRDTLGGVPSYRYGYSKPITREDGTLLGVVCASVEERALYYELLDRAKTQYHVQYYLISEQGQICSATRTGMIGRGVDAALGELGTVLQMPQQNVSGVMGQWLYASQVAPFSGVRLARLTERAAMKDELLSTRNLFIFLLAVCILVALLLAGVLVRWLYRPIDSLMHAMDEVGKGNLKLVQEKAQPEEFRRLSQRFNEMVGRMDSLVENLLDERMHKRQAELRALQHQIKPHFMYNTLNSIKYAAILQGNHKVGEQISAFIDLLEASTERKGAFLRLEDEIKLAESFASLQKYRYLDCFTVTYDIPPTAGRCFVPRLLLQPLIENAILHGMDPKRNDNHIHIAAMRIGESLMISVHDNGKGMDDAQQKALLYENVEDYRQFTGIGVFNIRQRMRLYYGEQGCFRLLSTPEEGTKIILELPASDEEKGGGI